MTEPEIPFVSELRAEVRRAVIADTAAPARQPQHVNGVLGWLQFRRRMSVLTAGGLTLAAAVIAAVILISAGASPPSAYALTQNADGSYTLTMQDVATAVPQVNAEFAKLGIPAKAIPVTPNCTAPPGGLGLLSPGGVSMSYSVTFSKDGVPPGWTDFIAAEQTPSGVRETIGSSSQPLPACLNSNQAPPVTVDPTK